MSYKLYILVAIAASAHGAPAEEPIRIDLPVYDQPGSPSDYKLAEPLELENHPGGANSDNSLITNFITNKVEAIGQKVSGPFATRITTLERAVEETEGYGSKILSVQENVGKAAADIFHPKPIVDTIREEDKYGNTGDKFYSTGKALVAGSSRLSTFVNSLLQIPGTIIRQITRVASEKLNNVGAKVVGL